MTMARVSKNTKQQSVAWEAGWRANGHVWIGCLFRDRFLCLVPLMAVRMPVAKKRTKVKDT